MSKELHEQINADLQAFQENPVEFMNRLPAKQEAQPIEDGDAAPAFTQEALDRHDYIEARDLFRRQAVDSG